ncbi:MAG: four helix bundle protein [Candidatus Omnitrophica bacterium]|nr:four helix bundle protein [Candidatus Omnitrophota bacterium]
MKIEKFEDIQSWQEAKELTNLVYEICKKSIFSKDFGLRDQIQRASVSIMANIAEGFDSQSDIEFIRFLNYSRRSASEVQSHLYVALEQKYINNDDFYKMYNKCKETKRLIGGFIKYLKRPRTQDLGLRTKG